jgi:hypothetical protein
MLLSRSIEAQKLSRASGHQQGTPASNSTIATVSDAEQSAGSYSAVANGKGYVLQAVKLE